MGIDLQGIGRKKSTHRKVLHSPNPYLRLLKNLYDFLKRRTTSSFNAVVAKRLVQSNRMKAPVSLRRVVKSLAGKPEDCICVAVSTITSGQPAAQQNSRVAAAVNSVLFNVMYINKCFTIS